MPNAKRSTSSSASSRGKGKTAEGASPAAENAALEQWLAPSTSSAIDQIDLGLIDLGWAPERVGEAPLDATLAAIQAVGVVEPVLLRPRSGGRFEVVTGHRTVLAAQAAGMARVPSVVKDLDEVGALMALVFDGSASGQVTADGAAELRRRLAAAGAGDEDIEDVMGAVGVAEGVAPAAAVAEEVAPAAAEEELVPVAEPALEAPAVAAEISEPVTEPALPVPVSQEPEPIPEPAVSAPVSQEISPSVPQEAEPEISISVPQEAETLREAEPVPEPAISAPAAREPEPVAEPAIPAVAAAIPEPEIPAIAASTRSTPTGGRWLPLPAGRPRLARLSSAFADAPRMLGILAGDKFTGTAELVGRDGRKDAIAFLDGRILATYVEQGERRVDAPLRLPSPERGPTVEITVRPHPRAVSVALALALRSPARYTGLHAAFLHLDGLIGLLKRERANAACVVTSSKGSGVILLDAGTPVAAYARRWGDEPGEEAETTDVSAVLDMLVSGDGEMDVHAGEVPEPLDLHEVVSRSVAGD